MGFIQTAHVGTGPLVGYTVPFLSSVSVSKIVAGAIGVLIVLAIVFITGRSLQTRYTNKSKIVNPKS
jgi:hypothetical protein